jgi:bacteriochlorophyll 4-vinyl reductase
MSYSSEPILPLSLLEAMRALDTPPDEELLDLDLAEEIRLKRFGLSEPVLQQMRRFRDAMKRGQQIPAAEVAALAQLVARRPDAAQAFHDAGTRTAAAAIDSVRAPVRSALPHLPGALSRPLALRQFTKLAHRFLGASVTRQGGALLLEIAEPVMSNDGNASGCAFYEGAFVKLLNQLTGNTASLQRMACVSRGDRSCQWRTDWRR